jgi:hypothetical protein
MGAKVPAIYGESYDSAEARKAAAKKERKKTDLATDGHDKHHKTKAFLIRVNPCPSVAHNVLTGVIRSSLLDNLGEMGA